MPDDLLFERRSRTQRRAHSKLVRPTTLKDLRIPRIARPPCQYIGARDEHGAIGRCLKRNGQAGATAATASDYDRLAVGSGIDDDAAPDSGLIVTPRQVGRGPNRLEGRSLRAVIVVGALVGIDVDGCGFKTLVHAGLAPTQGGETGDHNAPQQNGKNTLAIYLK